MKQGAARSDYLDWLAQALAATQAFEPLPDGGTRLVCVSPDGADKMRKKLKKSLIDGTVTRHRFYRAPGSEGGY